MTTEGGGWTVCTSVLFKQFYWVLILHLDLFNFIYYKVTEMTNISNKSATEKEKRIDYLFDILLFPMLLCNVLAQFD